jgi:hypothetical protein
MFKMITEVLKIMRYSCTNLHQMLLSYLAFIYGSYDTKVLVQVVKVYVGFTNCIIKRRRDLQISCTTILGVTTLHTETERIQKHQC